MKKWCSDDGALLDSAPEMLDLLERALPWMAKMKVEQLHGNTVAPSAFERVYNDMTDFVNRMDKKEVDHEKNDNH